MQGLRQCRTGRINTTAQTCSAPTGASTEILQTDQSQCLPLTRTKGAPADKALV